MWSRKLKQSLTMECICYSVYYFCTCTPSQHEDPCPSTFSLSFQAAVVRLQALPLQVRDPVHHSITMTIPVDTCTSSIIVSCDVVPRYSHAPYVQMQKGFIICDWRYNLNESRTRKLNLWTHRGACAPSGLSISLQPLISGGGGRGSAAGSSAAGRQPSPLQHHTGHLLSP